MRFTILLLALAAVFALANPTSIATRANMIVGNTSPGDRLLSRTYVQKPAYANSIRTEERKYRGGMYTRITAIYATEVGASQGANARIVQGGIDKPNVAVKFTSARGKGFYYQLEIWGR